MSPTADTAIVLACWPHTSGATAEPALAPLLDKPLLQRIVETLVCQGCHTLHVLLGEAPTALREFLGNGERWGIRIFSHYHDESLSLGQNLRPLGLDADASYWLANARTLPQADALAQTGAASLLCWASANGRPRWSGWARLSGAQLQTLPAGDARTLESCLLSGTLRHRMGPAPLSVEDDAALLDSTFRLLEAQSLPVRRGRGCIIPPSVRITGPVYIGGQVSIGANVRLGPNTVLCDRAVVDQGSQLTDCLVLPDTYVGPELELKQAIAAPGRLSSVTHGVVLAPVDPGFLAAVGQPAHASPDTALNRPPALLLQVLGWPLYRLARLCIAAEPTPSMEVVLPGNGCCHLPLADCEARLNAGLRGAWVRHFATTFYPGLSQVRRGRLRLFGPELRSAASIRQLPEEWQALYRATVPGLLNEGLLLPPNERIAAFRFIADACAMAPQPLLTRLGLLLRYHLRVGRDLLGTLWRGMEVSASPAPPSAGKPQSSAPLCPPQQPTT